MKTLPYPPLFAALLLLGSACSGDEEPGGEQQQDDERPPNILFITIDDIGVDQLEVYGFGGVLSPAATTPSIDAIAAGGIRFQNAWSMPTCSPTRATLYSGQYPFRNGVMNAVTSNDLAQSQLSPYAVTTPKLLREKGYISALVGKMHLTGSDIGPGNHPLGDAAYRELGWDFYAGSHDGGPYPIDTTGGGIAPEGTYGCGMVPITAIDAENGADAGICYFPNGDHLEMAAPDFPTPGRTCVERGGLLDPSGEPFSKERWADFNFDLQNGFYTAAWKVNHEDGRDEHIPVSDPRIRGYRTSVETDWAIDWLEKMEVREGNDPWMLSVGYSAIHTPLQPPPAKLLPNPDVSLSLIGCGLPVPSLLSELGGPVPVSDVADFLEARAVMQHMLEAMDSEIGRLLEAAGVLLRDEEGNLRHNPESETVVVIVGDNGTFAPSVKLPFDPMRAKGSPYQTGVWVPLLVAGPVVSEPGRVVEAMVNTTDLYRLFGELAGLDMEEAAERLQLDALPVLPYLKEPGHPSIRQSNFTEVGTNLRAVQPPPCVIPAVNVCVEIFPQAGVCEDQGGLWYGPNGVAGTEGLATCCEVNAYRAQQGEEVVDVFPRSQRAMRNDRYKLVRIERLDCESGEYGITDELYEINQNPNRADLKLDKEEENLLAGRALGDLSSEQRQNYEMLVDELEALLATHVSCPGDGNGDGVVDQTDLDEWEKWSQRSDGLSSWYDFNHDGRTDEGDRAIIETHLGTNCRE